MKRSGKVNLVLITAALASCNRYINPAEPPASGDPLVADSTAVMLEYGPGYVPWLENLTESLLFSFVPYPAAYYSVASKATCPAPASRPVRVFRGKGGLIVQGGWGKSAHAGHA